MSCERFRFRPTDPAKRGWAQGRGGRGGRDRPRRRDFRSLGGLFCPRLRNGEATTGGAVFVRGNVEPESRGALALYRSGQVRSGSVTGLGGRRWGRFVRPEQFVQRRPVVLGEAVDAGAGGEIVAAGLHLGEDAGEGVAG